MPNIAAYPTFFSAIRNSGCREQLKRIRVMADYGRGVGAVGVVEDFNNIETPSFRARAHFCEVCFCASPDPRRLAALCARVVSADNGARCARLDFGKNYDAVRVAADDVDFVASAAVISRENFMGLRFQKTRGGILAHNADSRGFGETARAENFRYERD